MPDSDVHAIACGPYLMLHLVGPRANRSHDLFFEGALGVEGTFTQFDRQSRRPPGGVVEVALQMARAFTETRGELGLGACNGRDELDPAPRTRDGDVQAPLTALPVERSEVHRELAVFITAVADAEDHDVTLVTLHVLQVLYEEAVEAVLREELVELRTVMTPAVARNPDGAGLCH